MGNFTPDLTKAHEMDAAYAAEQNKEEPAPEVSAGSEASPPEATPGQGTNAGEGEPEGDSGLSDILDDLEVDTKDELRDAIANLKNLKSKLGDKDPDELLAKVKVLEKYQADWDKEDEEKRLAEEDPEDTIARIRKENEDLKKTIHETKSTVKDQDLRRKVKADYDGHIATALERAKGVSSLTKNFAKELLKSDTPVATVDIRSKVAIRRMAEDHIKKVEEFRSNVIKEYIATKTSVPPVAKTNTAPTGAVAEKPKTFKEAAKAFLSQVKS